MDIGAWLRDLGLERYAASFRDNDIDAEVLPELTADDLVGLGVSSIGHRRKLLAAIAALRGGDVAISGPAAPERGERAVPPAGAERRQLTVMFCDLVGSTALSARLDPEDLREVIGAYHRSIAETVAPYDGFVAKYMGDGALIYFGYPRAHEDDAERAVHAALALIAAAHTVDMAQERLEMRIGIATGLAVVGDLLGAGAAQEEAVIGDTPNLAARLQALAPPNSCVIADTTRRLVGALFEYEGIGSVALKGFSVPIQAWRVLSESRVESRFEALRGGAATLAPLVGREEELDLLLRRWQQAKEGQGRVVLLSGEPGIGKSRLVASLPQQLAGQAYVRVQYFCSPHHQNSALYPVVGHLKRAAGFEHDDSAEDQLAKLRRVVNSDSAQTQDETIALLADLLSIHGPATVSTEHLTPQQRKEQTLAALVRQLAALAAVSPVLMVVEDAHWVDPTLRELLDLIIDRLPELAVLCLITFRPEFSPPWLGRPHVSLVTLNRLGREQGAAVVDRVAGKPLPAELMDQIVTRTDGVPLFVEELTKSVLESGLLRDDSDRYALVGPLPPLAIPTTLQDSLMARLDRYSTVKEVAQIGAAIGRQFPYALVAAASPLPVGEVERALAQLVESELIFCRGAPPEAIYTFKHALVQDAAYSTLLRGKRQQLHANIAAAMEAHFPLLVDSEPERAAHHFGEAGSPEKAAAYWSKAVERARRGYAVAEAIETIKLGLADIDRVEPGERQDRLHLDFTDRLAQCVYLQGRFTESLEILEGDADRLAKVDDLTLTGAYHFWMAHMYNRVGNWAEAHRHGDASIAAAERAGDAAALGKVLTQKSFTLYGEGSPAEGAEIGRRAAAILADTPERYWHGMAYFYVAMNLIHLGDTGPAVEAADAARAIGHEISDARVATYGAFIKGYALTAAGRTQEGRVACEEAVRLAPERISRAYASAVLGYNYLVVGDARAAADLLPPVIEELGRFPYPPWEGLFAAKLAEAWLEVGDFAEARRAAERAVRVTEGCGFPFGAGWARRALGRVAVMQGKLVEGRADLDRAREIFRSLGARLELADARSDL
jgi:class 3 adenylate cyclase/tetratricopeptide (TPR) repeat protein